MSNKTLFHFIFYLFFQSVIGNILNKLLAMFLYMNFALLVIRIFEKIELYIGCKFTTKIDTLPQNIGFLFPFSHRKTSEE